jgi:hypothetical protein
MKMGNGIGPMGKKLKWTSPNCRRKPDTSIAFRAGIADCRTTKVEE